MLPNEHFQKLLYDLFCLWHGVQRHYDPPFTDTEEQRLAKVKSMICKLLTEIDGRVLRIQQNQSGGMKGQQFPLSDNRSHCPSSLEPIDSADKGLLVCLALLYGSEPQVSLEE
ncbi:hypothetical protein ANCDUO_09442 [Ancylostoma duodenale]|uniref:Uncharacterized protein n=1 Tax=Ancylostoma duodenale TaxID=51022 RepID=A0A0C2GMU9_9BILA|nr:hypothetical protein ANCDUO_09442 [Ancylostoma duodenale]